MFSRRRLVVLRLGTRLRGVCAQDAGGSCGASAVCEGSRAGAALASVRQRGRDFFVINCAFLANFIEKIRKIWYN